MVLQEKIESSSKFWDLWDEELVIQVQRADNGDHQGVLLDFGDEDQNPFAEQIPFFISGVQLRDHDYAADRRFGFAPASKLSDALADVLQDEPFTVDSLPNLDRFCLVMRMLRDAAPKRFLPQVVSMTRNLLRRYGQKDLTRLQVINDLKLLNHGRGKNFQRFAEVVLERWDTREINAKQALYFFCGVQPNNDILWPVLQAVVLAALEVCELSIPRACRYLEALLPDPADYQEMVTGGRIAAVKTERDVLLMALGVCPTDSRATAQLSKIITNHTNEDLFLVTEAIKAMGLNNGKRAIPFLIECLDREEMERFWGDIEAALQRLCSGRKLIAQAIFSFDAEKLSPAELAAIEALEDHELRVEYDYWREIQKALPATPQAWFEHDSASVFWEKRLRCAISARNLEQPEPVLERLQRDEVAPVRSAAGGAAGLKD